MKYRPLPRVLRASDQPWLGSPAGSALAALRYATSPTGLFHHLLKTVRALPFQNFVAHRRWGQHWHAESIKGNYSASGIETRSAWLYRLFRRGVKGGDSQCGIETRSTKC